MGCSLCNEEAGRAVSGAETCKACGSNAEDRAFARLFLEYAHPAPHAKVLDVAPPAPQLAFFPRARFLGDARYTAISPLRLPEAERLAPPHRFLQMDITHLGFSDSSFDIIICNHVLPYVRSDFMAMSELHRCLKSEGMAFLNVSVAPGKSLRTGEGSGLPGTGREWKYGEDYFERLEAAGLFVLRLPLRRLLAGHPEGESVPAEAQQIFCFKYRDALERFSAKLPR